MRLGCKQPILSKLFPFLTFTFVTFVSNSQSIFCPNIDAGSNQTLNCSQPCANLSASYLDLRQTDSYIVQSIPHVPPLAYDQPGGAGVSVNIDDVFIIFEDRKKVVDMWRELGLTCFEVEEAIF